MTIRGGGIQDGSMLRLRIRAGTLALAVTWIFCATGSASEPRMPDASDRCQVCGMFVEGYPNWIAVVVFEDGSQFFFDGPKDMFKYIRNPDKYRQRPGAISRILVTDYYSTRLIDARNAVFVSGRAVMGPMGHELVPVASADHAKTFVEDHAGKAVLAFDEVTTEKIPR